MGTETIDVERLRELFSRDVPSPYREKSAEEVYTEYWSWYLMVRYGSIALMVALGALAIFSVYAGTNILYILGLGGVIVIGVVARNAINRRFGSLMAIVNQDCDPAKLREVMERIGKHNIRRQTKALTACYIAQCDNLDARPREALHRIENFTFGAQNVLWTMVFNIQALCADSLGFTRLRDEVMDRLNDLRTSLPKQQDRAIAEGLYHNLRQQFRPHESWGEADAAEFRARMEGASNRRERVEWCLKLAEYELNQGDLDSARTLLDPGILSPMVPRSALLRERLDSRLRGGDSQNLSVN